MELLTDKYQILLYYECWKQVFARQYPKANNSIICFGILAGANLFSTLVIEDSHADEAWLSIIDFVWSFRYIRQRSCVFTCSCVHLFVSLSVSRKTTDQIFVYFVEWLETRTNRLDFHKVKGIGRQTIKIIFVNNSVQNYRRESWHKM